MATEPVESRGQSTPVSGSLVVDEVKSVEAFAALEEEWRTFIEQAPAASFFHTWEWLTARLESYWADEELALLLVRRRGRLVATAPFVVDRQAEQWCEGSLTLPEDGVDLLSVEPVPEVLDALFAKLRASHRRWRIGLGDRGKMTA